MHCQLPTYKIAGFRVDGEVADFVRVFLSCFPHHILQVLDQERGNIIEVEVYREKGEHCGDMVRRHGSSGTLREFREEGNITRVHKNEENIARDQGL
jgi:hypothetical protein